MARVNEVSSLVLCVCTACSRLLSPIDLGVSC